jgi:hypothetical protein
MPACSTATIFYDGKPIGVAKDISYKDRTTHHDPLPNLGTFSISMSCELQWTRKQWLQFNAMTIGVKPHRKDRVTKRRMKRKQLENHRALLASMTVHERRLFKHFTRSLRCHARATKRAITIPVDD